jgi:hypothetical protein
VVGVVCNGAIIVGVDETTGGIVIGGIETTGGMRAGGDATLGSVIMGLEMGGIAGEKMGVITGLNGIIGGISKIVVDFGGGVITIGGGGVITAGGGGVLTAGGGVLKLGLVVIISVIPPKLPSDNPILSSGFLFITVIHLYNTLLFLVQINQQKNHRPTPNKPPSPTAV